MSDQIDVNQIAESLNTKLDLPTGKSQADIDYVIESKASSAEDPTWYRVYKSGWVEQGSIISGDSTDGSVSVTLPKEMANTLYSINFVPCMATNTGTASNLGAARSAGCYDLNSITVSGFTAQKQSTQTEIRWEVKGQGA